MNRYSKLVKRRDNLNREDNEDEYRYTSESEDEVSDNEDNHYTAMREEYDWENEREWELSHAYSLRRQLLDRLLDEDEDPDDPEEFREEQRQNNENDCKAVPNIDFMLKSKEQTLELRKDLRRL